MSMEKVKKFVKNHKTGIAMVAGGIITAGLSAFTAYKMHGIKTKEPLKLHYDDFIKNLITNCMKAGEGCEVYGISEPGSLWAAYDKDGNLVDAVKDLDGDLINPKMIMVFGDKVKK